MSRAVREIQVSITGTELAGLHKRDIEDKLVEELEGGGRHVMRGHVTTAKDAEEGNRRDGLATTERLTTDTPWRQLLCIELLL